MIDRRDVGSWLQGPGSVRTEPQGYPGQRLGMPDSGAGSLARFGRRLVAVGIDWVICDLIAFGLLDYRLGEGGNGPFKPLAVFVVMNVLLVGTLGSTIGHRLLGLRVVRLGGASGSPLASAGPLAAVIRTLLLALVIPALIWDRDTRGFHDKLAGTVLIRA